MENFIYRHHEVLRLELYDPDEAFPIPLKYIDVMIQTQTSINYVSEHMINSGPKIQIIRTIPKSFWLKPFPFETVDEESPPLTSFPLPSLLPLSSPSPRPAVMVDPIGKNHCGGPRKTMEYDLNAWRRVTWLRYRPEHDVKTLPCHIQVIAIDSSVVRGFQRLRILLRLSVMDRTGLGFRANIVEKYVVLSAVLHIVLRYSSPSSWFSTQREICTSLSWTPKFQRSRILFRPSVLDGAGLGLRAGTAEKYVLLSVLRDFPCRGHVFPEPRDFNGYEYYFAPSVCDRA